MAKTSRIVKTNRLQESRAKARAKGVKAKFSTKCYNRCGLCGRVRGYIRFFDMCRICIREKARRGELAGVKKASW